MTLVTLAELRNSFLAGACGTLAHTLLMWLRGKIGLLPAFQPYDDLQRLLSWLAGSSVNPSVTWLLSFVHGALIWGFVFGKTYRWLPGRRPLAKGVFFGVCVWALMGFVFFPLAERGVFALGLGLGAAPALLMFVMLLAYSVAMSFAYHLLTGRRGS